MSGTASARAPLWEHFRPGQLLELSGVRPGKLSAAVRLIAHAQSEGEPVAWVTVRGAASFYPPDFALAGVDLAALVVVRLPAREEDARASNERRGRAGSASHALVRASEVLLRSGAFGLVVIDFGAAPIPRGELAWQARLSGLVRHHDARVVLLTSSPSDEPSLGPLIALRIQPELTTEAGRDGARVVLKHEVLKSKLGLAAAMSPDVRSLPLGACARRTSSVPSAPRETPLLAAVPV